MPRFRKKPVEIEAIQLTGWSAWSSVCDFLGDFDDEDGDPRFAGAWVDPEDGTYTPGEMPPPDLSVSDAEIGLVIYTLEGAMLARQGDWIIRGVKGEYYPCKPDIFEATYELAHEKKGDDVHDPFEHYLIKLSYEPFAEIVGQLGVSKRVLERLDVGDIVVAPALWGKSNANLDEPKEWRIRDFALVQRTRLDTRPHRDIRKNIQ